MPQSTAAVHAKRLAKRDPEAYREMVTANRRHGGKLTQLRLRMAREGSKPITYAELLYDPREHGDWIGLATTAEEALALAHKDMLRTLRGMPNLLAGLSISDYEIIDMGSHWSFDVKPRQMAA